MGIISTIVVGFIVGLVARALLPGKQAMGFVLTAVLGVVGSLLATYLGQAMGWYTAGAGAGIVASIVGAIVVLVVYGLVTRRRSTSAAPFAKSRHYVEYR